MTKAPEPELFALFCEACELSPPAQAVFVAGVEQRNPEVARELQALLDADTRSSRAPGDSVLKGLVADAWSGSQSVAAVVKADLALLARWALPAGRLEVRDEIGRGGMGQVHEAWDASLQRVVARKTLRETSGPVLSSSRLQRFLAEARVTGGLEHPGIVPVHDLGVDAAGTVFFTMQRVRGRNLQEIYELERSAAEGWNRARVLSVLQRVCEAMAYAHAQGVVHRDLKPANIMVGAFGEVYVMDWGVARVRGKAIALGDASAAVGTPPNQLTRDGAVIGTPKFMSPEQAAGRIDEVDERSDVYAVGAMLFELLAGDVRAEEDVEESPGAVLDGKAGGRSGNRTLLRSVPPELASIGSKAMARDRAARYPDMQALALDLRAFLEDRVVRAHRTGAFVELRKWVRRNRLAAAALAVASLALIGGTIAAKTSEQRAIDRAEEFDLLSTVEQHRRAVAKEATLYPAWPGAIPAMEAWLRDECDSLLVRRPDLRTAVGDLERRATLTDSQRFLRDRLVEVLPKLDALETARAAVAARCAWASQFRQLTLAHPRARHSWDHVRAAIAKADGVVASESYAGQRIELLDEQIWGLVPIGMNPRTRLWEFYDLRSAWDGAADPATIPIPEHQPDGTIAVSGATGIVFVLLPGTEFLMGAQPGDRGSPNFDEWAQSDELPAATIRLDPFFLAKHEVTQGQWARLWDGDESGRWPSYQRAGMEIEGEQFGPAHPVEQVDWDSSQRVMFHHGLVLPTEAQWEYGCRAGSTTAWYQGAAPTDVIGHANLLDLRTAQKHPDWTSPSDYEVPDDLCLYTAPVGRYGSNGFGLHDVYGNVNEWCRDVYVPNYGTERNGDGMRPEAPEPVSRVNRGGNYMCSALSVRSTVRTRIQPTTQLRILGLRAARTLVPLR